MILNNKTFPISICIKPNLFRGYHLYWIGKITYKDLGVPLEKSGNDDGRRLETIYKLLDEINITAGNIANSGVVESQQLR